MNIYICILICLYTWCWSSSRGEVGFRWSVGGARVLRGILLNDGFFFPDELMHLNPPRTHEPH